MLVFVSSLYRLLHNNLSTSRSHLWAQTEQEKELSITEYVFPKSIFKKQTNKQLMNQKQHRKLKRVIGSSSNDYKIHQAIDIAGIRGRVGFLCGVQEWDDFSSLRTGSEISRDIRFHLHIIEWLVWKVSHLNSNPTSSQMAWGWNWNLPSFAQDFAVDLFPHFSAGFEDIPLKV